jgi:hypothetical protein
MADSWDDRAYLRGTQYKTDANLAARQSIYAYQQPYVDLAARVVDLAAPAPSPPPLQPRALSMIMKAL